MRSGGFDVGFVIQVRGRQPVYRRDDSGKLDLYTPLAAERIDQPPKGRSSAREMMWR